MNNSRIILAALCLLAAPLASAAPIAPAQEPKESREYKQATQNLNAFTKYALAGSIATLGLGVAAKNDVLKGLGIGGLTGVGTGLLQKNINWTLSWVAAWFGRTFLVSKFASQNPATIDVSNNEIDNPSDWWLKLQFKNPAFDTNTPEMREVKTNLVKVRKAIATLQDTSWATSWATYLAYCYLEKKAEKLA